MKRKLTESRDSVCAKDLGCIKDGGGERREHELTWDNNFLKYKYYWKKHNLRVRMKNRKRRMKAKQVKRKAGPEPW